MYLPWKQRRIPLSILKHIFGSNMYELSTKKSTFDNWNVSFYNWNLPSKINIVVEFALKTWRHVKKFIGKYLPSESMSSELLSCALPIFLNSVYFSLQRYCKRITSASQMQSGIIFGKVKASKRLQFYYKFVSLRNFKQRNWTSNNEIWLNRSLL